MYAINVSELRERVIFEATLYDAAFQNSLTNCDGFNMACTTRPRALRSRCYHLEVASIARKVVGLQLVLLRTVYSQTRGCVCTALELGGDVKQPWLVSKHEVIHKTGCRAYITYHYAARGGPSHGHR